MEEMEKRHEKQKARLYLAFLIQDLLFEKNPYEEKQLIKNSQILTRWFEYYKININFVTKDEIDTLFIIWYARDLQIQLGYKRWENFIETIKKTMQSCENAGIEVNNHFREVTKMVQIGSGASRNLQDIIWWIKYNANESKIWSKRK